MTAEGNHLESVGRWGFIFYFSLTIPILTFLYLKAPGRSKGIGNSADKDYEDYEVEFDNGSDEEDGEGRRGNESEDLNRKLLPQNRPNFYRAVPGVEIDFPPNKAKTKLWLKAI